MQTSSGKTWWETTFPAVTWLRNYHRAWFRLDLPAGITLAAYLLPAALGAVPEMSRHWIRTVLICHQPARFLLNLVFCSTRCLIQGGRGAGFRVKGGKKEQSNASETTGLAPLPSLPMSICGASQRLRFQFLPSVGQLLFSLLA